MFEDAVARDLPDVHDGGTEHHGKYFDIPLRNVVPKPLQKPHPPLWMACSQLPTIACAGEKGIGALGFQFVSADAAHAWVHAYYNAITKRLEKLADYQINPNMALVSFFMCAKTDEEARARADGATFFQFALRFYGARRTASVRRPARSTCGTNTTSGSATTPSAGSGPARRPDRLARNHPQEAAAVRSSHIDQVILLNQAGRNSHEDICDWLELFAKEVMPEFQQRSRARGLEGRRAERRDPARGDRHRGFQGPLRQARGQRGQARRRGGGVVPRPAAITTGRIRRHVK